MMQTTIVIASQTSRKVRDIGFPALSVPLPQKYRSINPTQLTGGPGRPGRMLPAIPMIPANTAKIAINVVISGW